MNGGENNTLTQRTRTYTCNYIDKMNYTKNSLTTILHDSTYDIQGPSKEKREKKHDRIERLIPFFPQVVAYLYAFFSNRKKSDVLLIALEKIPQKPLELQRKERKKRR